MPADFPEDAYCCDGSIKTALKVPNGHQLGIESTASAEKLVADARTFMTGKGWSETIFLSQGGTTTLGFTKDEDARTYMLNASAGEGKTAVTIAVVNE